MELNWILIGSLSISCVVVMIAERMGLPTTLVLNFKGDVKRETRWFAQYGQAACSVVGALIVWRLEGSWHNALPLAAAPLLTGLAGGGVKRLFGRVRPGHPGAGSFKGFSLKHANWRESFPSNHSATAVSFTLGLAYLYPQLAIIVWPLAIFCALIRYLMDAHWPSDVLGGLAFGCLMTPLVWGLFRHVGW